MAGLSGLSGLSGEPGIFGGGLTYLLQDEFTTDRAAGSVNGTAAEPGPGTRVVTDTAGTGLSITGGKAVFNTLNAQGDPGIWYQAVSRVAGRFLIMEFDGADDWLRIGFDPNQAGPVSVEAFYLRGGNELGVLPPSQVIVGVWNIGTSYSLCIVLRGASGAYYFVKGGAFTNWSLLWLADVNSSDPLYPGAQPSLVSSAGISSFKVPDVIWVPTPLAYDTFTRGDGALGSSETSGPESQAVTARTWNNRVGTTQISSNAASASALAGGIAIATVDTSTTDVIVSSALTRSGDEIGVVLRYADSSNYVRAYHDGTNAKLDKVVGGGVTNVISAVQAYAAGADIVVIADGTSFSLCYNNTKIGSTSTIGDAALQTGTEQGTYSTNTGNSQDNMTVFPRGSGNEYAQLDKY